MFPGRYIVVLCSVCLLVIPSAAYIADCLSGFSALFSLSSVMYVCIWDGAELCDAFQFFCAVILCGDLHGFSNLCRELYAAAYVLRAAILYNIFVYSCCRQGGFTRRRERRSDSAVFCRYGSLLIAEFLSAPMFRYGGYFTLFSRLKFALLSAMKNLKFLKITAVMIG